MTIGLLSFVVAAGVGKNQMGLNGIANSSNIYPFTNWFNQASLSTATITQAISAGGGTITQTAGTATITTPNPHGLPTGQVWNLTVSGANQSGYNLTGSIFTVTGASTITYPVNSGTVSPATGTITFSFTLNNGTQGAANVLQGSPTNANQFVTVDGWPVANQSNVTSLTYNWIYNTLNGTSWFPVGYTRAGQNLICAWTGNVAGSVSGWTNATNSATLTWTTAMDVANNFITMSIPNPADVPTNIFVGLTDSTGHVATDNYAAWQAGQYLDPAYKAMLAPACGTIRFMDWMNTNQTIPLIDAYSDIATTSTQAWGNKRGMPVAVMCQLANQANKNPWFNVPVNLGNGSKFNGTITNISISSPGSNAIVTFRTAHSYSTGDPVIMNLVGGGGTSNSGFGTQGTATFNVASSYVTLSGINVVVGQQLWFSGGTIPSNLFGNQSYFVTNIGVAGAGTFQLASTLANAIAVTAITFTGSSSGTITGTVDINRKQFTVGATTTFTLELTHCDSSSFGTAPASGQAIQPFSLTGMTTEITNYVSAIKALLNSNLTPRFEFGNELWNTVGDNPFAWMASQAHCFTLSSGVFPFAQGGDNNNKMAGYLIAHIMKTIRDIYGKDALAASAAGPGWQGILATQSLSTAFITNDLLTGVDFYLTNILSNSLNRNNILTNIAITNYYGSIFGSANNGHIGNFSNVTINATSPATVTLSSGSNSMPIGTPIIFWNSTNQANLPNDLATGQPLGSGIMSPWFSGISGYFSGTTFTCTGITGTPLTVGMTIWGPIGLNSNGTAFLNGTVAVGGVQPAVIQSLGTGTGGTGTYTMSVSQTVGSSGSPISSMQAMNMTLNCSVYFTTSTGNNFTFSSTLGGSNVNVDPANPGSGTQNCASGTATQFCSWMNTSVALNQSTPATYPSRYSYWNTTVNNAVFDPVTGTTGIQAFWLAQVTPCVTTGSTMPSALGLVAYEGGQNNTLQSNTANGTTINTAAMTSQPMFQEFWPQCVNTTEDAAVWTGVNAAWFGLKAYAIAQSVPNAANLIMGQPAQFVDANINSYLFSFGSNWYCDHALYVAGSQYYGAPTWQHPTGHAMYDAVVGTN